MRRHIKTQPLTADQNAAIEAWSKYQNDCRATGIWNQHLTNPLFIEYTNIMKKLPAALAWRVLSIVKPL